MNIKKLILEGENVSVDFKNTIIIMTSNVGAQSIRKQNVLGFSNFADESKEEYDRMKETITEELKRTFRPEFLNRLDDVIVFHSLKEDQVREIVDIMIEDLEKRLSKLDVRVKISDETKEYISKQGFDPVYGARPLERTIRKMIEDQLAEEILKGAVKKEGSILIDYDGDKLLFSTGPVV